ncbi:GNAT family N-acetyltransferase [Georgenia muralis]
MSTSADLPDVTGATLAAQLPPGWTARPPLPADVAAVADLVRAHQLAARGAASVDTRTLTAELVGEGSWTRTHLLVLDPAGALRARASVHDRAAGRAVVAVTVHPDVEGAGPLAAALLTWAEGAAVVAASHRGLAETQLDAGAYADDEHQRRWLAGAGYRHARTWLQMSRPVTAADAEGLPGAVRPGVRVRAVGKHEDGMPVADDLRTVHRILEESFEDHFNSYRESFPEFVQRLRQDPGHRWDHWWIASVEIDGEEVPAGALVGSVTGPDDAPGSYVDYIGVHRRARGRGVAKALLSTVVADAASRGRSRVGLEVDADSPTGADGLYASLGWVTAYRTESWHRDVPVPPA